MEIMKAATAREMTVKAIEGKFTRMLDMMNTRIMTDISLGRFESEFRFDDPAIQDKLFDYFTSLGYAVRFSQTIKHVSKYGRDSYIMTISWEDAIQ